MEQDKETKEKWKGPKNLDICLSAIVSYYVKFLRDWELGSSSRQL